MNCIPGKEGERDGQVLMGLLQLNGGAVTARILPSETNLRHRWGQKENITSEHVCGLSLGQRESNNFFLVFLLY